MPDLSPPGTESDFYFVQADDPKPPLLALSSSQRREFPSGSGSTPSATSKCYAR